MRHKNIKICDLEINPRSANYSNFKFKLNRGTFVPHDKYSSICQYKLVDQITKYTKYELLDY